VEVGDVPGTNGRWAKQGGGSHNQPRINGKTMGPEADGGSHKHLAKTQEREGGGPINGGKKEHHKKEGATTEPRRRQGLKMRNLEKKKKTTMERIVPTKKGKQETANAGKNKKIGHHVWSARGCNTDSKLWGQVMEKKPRKGPASI